MNTPIQHTPTTNPSTGDWDPSYVRHRLAMAGHHSLRKLCRDNNLNEIAGSIALRRPWYRVEQVIAGAIGVPWEEIWPSRIHVKRALLRSAFCESQHTTTPESGGNS